MRIKITDIRSEDAYADMRDQLIDELGEYEAGDIACCVKGWANGTVYLDNIIEKDNEIYNSVYFYAFKFEIV